MLNYVKNSQRHKYLCKRLQEVYVALEDSEEVGANASDAKTQSGATGELDEIEKKMSIVSVGTGGEGSSESGKTNPSRTSSHGLESNSIQGSA